MIIQLQYLNWKKPTVLRPDPLFPSKTEMPPWGEITYNTPNGFLIQMLGERSRSLSSNHTYLVMLYTRDAPMRGVDS